MGILLKVSVLDFQGLFVSVMTRMLRMLPILTRLQKCTEIKIKLRIRSRKDSRPRMISISEIKLAVREKIYNGFILDISVFITLKSKKSLKRGWKNMCTLPVNIFNPLITDSLLKLT